MKLTIDLTVRLPDVNRENDIPTQYDDYGRFAVLKGGSYWFAGVRSSHPDVRAGFYWALNRADNTLYISPRGAVSDLQSLDDELVFFLIDKLGLRNKYRGYIVKR
jgi:hypothetical protein